MNQALGNLSIAEGAQFFLTDRTQALLATKEGDMFLYADSEGNLRASAGNAMRSSIRARSAPTQRWNP